MIYEHFKVFFATDSYHHVKRSLIFDFKILKKLLKQILAIVLFDLTVSVGLTILFRMVSQRNVIHRLLVNTFAVQNGGIVEVPKSIVIALIVSIIEIHVQKVNYFTEKLNRFIACLLDGRCTYQLFLESNWLEQQTFHQKKVIL